MQGLTPLRSVALVLTVLSAMACGGRGGATSPPQVATAVRPSVTATVAAQPTASAPATSASQAYRTTPLNPPVTLKVGTVNSTSDAGIFVAIEKGYFRDEGIQLELENFQTAAAMIAPLGTGQLDIATGAIAAGIFNAAARDVPLRIVADKGSTPGPDWDFVNLMVRRDLIEFGQVRDYSDLKGLNISTTAPGNSTEIELAKALEKGGLKFEDITYMPLAFPDMITAFANRAIDAGMVAEPFVARIESLGTAVRWRGNSDFVTTHLAGGMERMGEAA